MRPFLSLTHIRLFACFALLGLWMHAQLGCANISAPTGGFKDTLAPRLIKATPTDSSTGFNSKTIVFQFDEYVDVKDVMQELIVSPLPNRAPDVTYKLRTVTVKLKDTLSPNTTYAFDFGNAIKDVNEGNPYKNFSYVFTTGTKLDQNTLVGKVILAKSGAVDSTLRVILHVSSDDSAVVKKRPQYVAKLDGKGQFQFLYLPAATYQVYAVSGEGGQYAYNDPSQLFAFYDSPVNTGVENSPILLYAYEEEKPKPAASTATPRVNVGMRDKKADERKDKRLQYSTSLQNNEQDVLQPLVVTFVDPLKTIDSTKFSFQDGSGNPVKPYQVVLDSTRTQFTLTHAWKPGNAYQILVQKGWAEDSSGKTVLRNDTLRFQAMKATAYGSVRLRITNLDLSQNPVLLLYQSGELKYTHVFTSKEFKTTLFKPGDYEVRVLLDKNKNGKWDTGKFFEGRRQPEVIKPISKKWTVKANWDNEVDMTL
jgi:hypothetical protein